jgi:ribonuclease P protein component
VRRDLRLRDNSDFQRVRRVGKSVANSWLVLVQAPNPQGRSRYGFTVSKKLGGAVQRNKLKRRLREHLRLHLQASRLRPGVDVVVIARRAARGADYQTLSHALDDLLARARLLKRNEE